MTDRTEAEIARRPPARRAARRARSGDDRPAESSSARSSTRAWRGCTSPRASAASACRPKLQNAGQRAADRGAARRVPYGRNPIGYGMCAPTIVTHGSDEQKRRYLRPLFTGEEIWCQLFSEPGAGSDVAGLVDAGGARRRRVDRQRPEGVDDARARRPLRHASSSAPTPSSRSTRASRCSSSTCTRRASRCGRCVQMTGEAEFNEVYFTDVRIPDSERLGDVGEGWRVSLTTLMNERVSIGGSRRARGARADRRGRARCGSEHASARDAGRARPAHAAVDRGRGATGSPTSARRRTASRARPGPEGSVGKLAMAELNQRIYELRASTCMGPDGDALRRLHDGPARRTPMDSRHAAEGVPAGRRPTRSRAARPRS